MRPSILPCIISAILPLCNSIQVQDQDWQPLLQPEIFQGSHEVYPDAGVAAAPPSFSSIVAQSYQQNGIHESDQCELYKVGFKQDLYFQYIQYKVHMPKLKEFTLCYWAKYTNHSNDHPLFSYAVEHQPRAIYAWVSNTERSSYYSLAVEGHTLYRLNYPLRLNRWYHTCQSWNGRTGEWQIWVNAERVGRGFHNRLVDHVIPPGGIAITGQEQRQIGGGFLEGKDAPKGAGGMLGEVAMLQLYGVALTAGKAHRDHKHHHAHQYDHNGTPITTTPLPPPAPRATQPTHPLLTAGQINPNLRLNLAGPQPTPQTIQGQNFNAQFLNGQFLGNLVTQQLSRTPQTQFGFRQPQQLSLPRQQSLGVSPVINGGLVHPSLVNPANVQFIDNSKVELDTHQLFKRGSSEDTANFGEKIKSNKTKREEPGDEKGQKKRELLIAGGHLFDDSLIGGGAFDKSLLDGLAGIGQNEPILQKQQQNDEREPAEAEVKAVMNVCSGCDPEPFDKALVFGWRTAPKKLYSGAFYVLAAPHCKAF